MRKKIQEELNCNQIKLTKGKEMLTTRKGTIPYYFHYVKKEPKMSMDKMDATNNDDFFRSKQQQTK